MSLGTKKPRPQPWMPREIDEFLSLREREQQSRRGYTPPGSRRQPGIHALLEAASRN